MHHSQDLCTVAALVFYPYLLLSQRLPLRHPALGGKCTVSAVWQLYKAAKSSFFSPGQWEWPWMWTCRTAALHSTLETLCSVVGIIFHTILSLAALDLIVSHSPTYFDSSPVGVCWADRECSGRFPSCLKCEHSAACWLTIRREKTISCGVTGEESCKYCQQMLCFVWQTAQNPKRINLLSCRT